MSAVQSVAGNPEVEDVALDLVRDRLAGLGRQYTPVDVATAMRAEGLIVSDSAVLDTVESLRRHSVGAGPLEPMLHEPGVTDVLVNGSNQVFVDRGAGLELTDLRFPCEGDVRRLAQRMAASVGRRLDESERRRRFGQLALGVWFRGDFALAQPGAFTVVTGNCCTCSSHKEYRVA